MDMVVVAENNDKTTKDHQSIAEESLKINPDDYAEDESPDSTSSEQP